VNPSFETGSGIPYSAGTSMLESQINSSPTIDGWYTNHPPASGYTSPIESWKGSSNPDRNTPAQQGNYFVELNAYQQARLYQIVYLVNGENINWRYYHRARGSYGTQTLEFSIFSRDGSSKIATINTHTASSIDAWDDVNGSYVFTGATGIYQIGFESITAGSAGNFLDNVTIDLKAFTEFTQASVLKAETNTTYRPYIRLNGEVKTNSTITFTVTATNAAEGVDYNFPTKTITIQPGKYSSADSIPLSFVLVNHTPVTGPKQITLNASVTGDVELRDANGDGFTGTLTVNVYENLPGGISIPNLWFKANTGVTTGAAFNWDNEGALLNARASQSTASNRPLYNTASSNAVNQINFNPSISFDGSNDYLSTINLNIIPVNNNSTAGSQFVVFRRKAGSTGVVYSNGGPGFAFGVGSTVDGGMWLSNLGFHNTVPDSSVAMISLVGTASASNPLLIMQRNGSRNFTTINAGGFAHVDNQVFEMGRYNNASFANMDLSEIIIYPSAISNEDRVKVQSYLGLKYGISLGNNIDPVDYVSSSNQFIWNSSNIYKYDIFGIGRDDLSGLNQIRSSSANTSRGDGTGISGKASVTVAAVSPLDNNEFLVIGHDNGALTEVATNLPASELRLKSKRLSRQWKVKHTGNVGKLNLYMDISGLCLTSSKAADFKLIVDIDGDGDFSTGKDSITVAASLSNNVLLFNNILLPNNSFFTLIVSNPGVVSLPGAHPNQQVCLGEKIADTRFLMNQTSTGATVVGLPAGITSTITNGIIITIRGTSTQTGTFPYMIIPKSSGCSPGTDTLRGTLIIKPVPVKPTITATGPTAFCVPGSVALSGGAATGNQWLLNQNPITNATGATYTATTSGSYTLINTQDGCSSPASDVVNVSANTIPSPPVIKNSKSPTICSGEVVKLSTSGQTGIQWFKDGVAITGATNNFYDASVSGVYSVTTTNTNGCVSGNSNTIAVTVNPLPTAGTISGNATVCSGVNLPLTNTGSSGGTVSWSVNNASIANIDGSGNVMGLSAGVVTVSYTVLASSGCGVTTTKDITIVGTPSKPVVIPSGPTAFCTPGSVVLSAGSASGNQWLLNGTAINGANAATFTATGSGTYTLVNSNSGCASPASDPVDITANATPTIPVIKVGKDQSATVCEGGNVKMFTSGQTGIQWFKDGVSIPGATSNFYDATQSGQYYIEVSNTNGCVSGNSNSINVTVNPLPNAGVITGNNSVCAGSTLQLNNTKATGGVWSISNNSIATINGAGFITGITPGIVTVTYTVTNVNGCATSVSQDITVLATPVKPVIVPTGPIAFCAPGSVLLSSSGLVGNQWYVDGNPIPNQNGSDYTATATGAYTLVNIVGGCSSPQSDIVKVSANTIPAPPSIRFAKSTTICAGEQVRLSTSGQTGIQWLKDGVIIAGATANFYDATVSGIYTVTVTNSSGCVSGTSNPVTVTVNPLPTAGIIAGSSVVCEGSDIQLSNSTSGGIWDVGNSSMASITASGLLTGVAAGRIDVNYYVTNSFGCGTVATKSILINARPVKPDITAAGSIAFCAPGSVGLTASSSSGIQWALNGTAINGATAGNYTATASGSYSITNTQNGCTSLPSDPIDVSANATPLAPVIKAIKSTNLCEGDQVKLFTSGNTGIQWFKDGKAITDATNNFYNATNSGSYSITVANTSGCISGSSNTINVTVNPLPVVENIIGNSSLCIGASQQLLHVTSGGVWSSNNNAVANVTGAGLVTGNIAGNATIIYTVTNQSGCVQQANLPIIVNALPGAISISGENQVCVGNTIQLSCSSTGGTWSSNNTAIATINNTGIVTGISTGNVVLTYTFTNQSGCSTTTNWNLTVKAKPVKPVITASGSTSFCSPGNVILNSSAANGNQWYLNGTVITTAVNSSYTTSQSGTYTIVVTENGCSSIASDQIEVTANAAALAPVLKAAKQTSICAGDGVQLHTSTQSGNEWYRDGVLIAGVSGSTYTATQSGVYTIRTVNAASCVSGTSNSVVVTVNPIPAIGNITGANIVCSGNNTTFNNSVAGGVWSSSNTNIATINSSGLVTALNQGTSQISYTVTGQGGCTSVRDFVLQVNQTPQKPVISTSGPTTLCTLETVTLASSNALGNQWYLNGVAITNATNSSYATSAAGSYTVVNTNAGCRVESDTVSVVTITGFTSPVIKASDTIACYGQPVILSASVDRKNRWYRDGVLIPNAYGKQFRPTVSGTYTVETGQGNFCVSGISNAVTITIYDKIVVPEITSHATTVCVGGGLELKNPLPNGIWQSSDNSIATINSKGQVSGIRSGTVQISYTVNNGLGCAESATRNITVFGSPTPQPITGTLQVCVGNNTQLSNASIGGHWISADTSVASVNGITGNVTGKRAGNSIINYLITNNNGCVALSAATVTVNALPAVTATANPVRVSKGLNTTLTATGIGAVTWTPSQYIITPNAAITTARVVAPTVYTVRLTDLNGCVNTATVSVDVVDDLFVEPIVVFTPNGDGINDFFVIKNLDVYPVNQLSIYDKSGKLLYRTSNYNNRWDGRVGGKLLDKDTYMYVLTVNGVVVKKGAISLIR